MWFRPWEGENQALEILACLSEYSDSNCCNSVSVLERIIPAKCFYKTQSLLSNFYQLVSLQFLFPRTVDGFNKRNGCTRGVS